jgi:hypothetical protein
MTTTPDEIRCEIADNVSNAVLGRARIRLSHLPDLSHDGRLYCSSVTA